MGQARKTFTQFLTPAFASWAAAGSWRTVQHSATACELFLWNIFRVTANPLPKRCHWDPLPLFNSVACSARIRSISCNAQIKEMLGADNVVLIDNISSGMYCRVCGFWLRVWKPYSSHRTSGYRMEILQNSRIFRAGILTLYPYPHPGI